MICRKLSFPRRYSSRQCGGGVVVVVVVRQEGSRVVENKPKALDLTVWQTITRTDPPTHAKRGRQPKRFLYNMISLHLHEEQQGGLHKLDDSPPCVCGILLHAWQFLGNTKLGQRTDEKRSAKEETTAKIQIYCVGSPT